MEIHNDLKKPLTISLFILNFLQTISAARAPAETPSPYAQAPSWAPSPYAQAPSWAPSPSEAPSTSPKPPVSTQVSDPLAPKDSLQENELQTFHPVSAASGIENMNREVKKMCDGTDYSSLCQSSILPLAHLDGRTDPPTVLQLAIKAATHETKSAISAAQTLINSPNVGAGLASSLDDCKSSYENILSSFQEAQDAIPQDDKSTINSMLSAAISDIGTCNDGFSESNPVAALNQKLTQLVSNSLAIAAQIN